MRRRPRRRAVWAELVPYGELCSPAVLELLRSRSLGVQVAVTPDLLSGVGRVARVCREAGIELGLWPMLSRQDGRWPSAANVAPFEAFVAELLDVLERNDGGPATLTIDLEPPIDELGSLLRVDHQAMARRLRRGLSQHVIGRFERIVTAAHDRGMATMAAALPTVLSDGRRPGGWQGFLGTPVDGLPVSRVTVMVYTSLLEGYARGLLRRADAVSLLSLAAGATARRYGERGSLSLGATGTGALGDEPVYRHRAELVEDVAVTRAAGIDDILLFSLGGVLGRSAPEA